MDPAQRVIEIVEQCVAALERGAPEAVDSLCREHPNLEAAVRARLSLLAGVGLLGDGNLGDGNRSGAIPADIDVLESFGAYRIVRQLGAGGMGTVWLAEQDQPIRRQVALKVVKAGMDSAEVLARFNAERRALALMNHAHIAQIFDAGVTPNGRPYFAMEYVEGATITEWADKKKLTTDARLCLLLPVLDAVQHAHQKGILHRDLKPSNVLVTERDGQAVPKVIDFGVAKVLDTAAMQHSVATMAGFLVGTPEYMSPEQAGDGPGDVDTRSDVYAFGVLLYELLTGTLPLEGDDFRRAGMREMLRLIREAEPRVPSSRVTTLGARSHTVASARRTTPDGLRRLLRGELDWILLKALDKDRDRRYATVKDLADDLRRHLERRPVVAAPPSAWYRTRKLCARHGTAMSAAAAVLIALVAGLATSLWFASQREEQRALAAANFERAMAAVDEMLTQVGDSDLDHVPQAELVRRRILERAVAFYEDLVRRDVGRVDAARELALVRQRLGSLYHLLGDEGKAEDAYRTALADFERLRATRPDDLELLVGEALAQHDVAIILHDTGRYAESRAHHDIALPILRSVASTRPDLLRPSTLLADVLHTRGGYESRRDLEQSCVLYKESLACFERLLAARPDQPSVERKLAQGRAELATQLRARGDGAEAHAMIEQALTQIRALATRAPHRRDVRETLAFVLDRSGVFVNDAGDPEASEERAREAVDVSRKLVADYPAAARYRERLASHLNNLGFLLYTRGEPAARAVFAESVAQREELVALQPQDVGVRAGLVMSLANFLSMEIEAIEAGGSAPEHFASRAERAVELARALVSEKPDDAMHQYLLGDALYRRGMVHESESALPEAAAAYDAAVVASEAAVRLAPNRADFCDLLATSYCGTASLALGRGDVAKAQATFDSAMAVMGRAIELQPQAASLRAVHAELRTDRADSLLTVSDHAAAAAVLTEADLAAAGTPEYLLAGVKALAECIDLVGRDEQLSAAAREAAAQAYSEQALGLLRRAHAAVPLAPSLLNDSALAPLVSRPGVRKRVQELGTSR